MRYKTNLQNYFENIHAFMFVNLHFGIDGDIRRDLRVLWLALFWVLVSVAIPTAQALQTLAQNSTM